jgi:hypothetical protein
MTSEELMMPGHHAMIMRDDECRRGEIGQAVTIMFGYQFPVRYPRNLFVTLLAVA